MSCVFTGDRGEAGSFSVSSRQEFSDVYLLPVSRWLPEPCLCSPFSIGHAYPAVRSREASAPTPSKFHQTGREQIVVNGQTVRSSFEQLSRLLCHDRSAWLASSYRSTLPQESVHVLGWVSHQVSKTPWKYKVIVFIKVLRVDLFFPRDETRPRRGEHI
jgi:hypothetical protein